MGTKSGYLPDVWDNDIEMAGLMSLPKARRVNPTNYDRVVNFWKGCIADYCKAEKTCVFTLDELKREFRRGAQVPSPLDATLHEMQDAGQIQTKESLARRNQGWLEWGVSFINPFAWVGSAGSSQSPDMQFVHLDTLKTLADDVLCFHRQRYEGDENGDVIVDLSGYNELKDATRGLVEGGSFDLVLDELVAMGELSIGTSKDGEKVLKFKEQSSRGPAKLTDIDVSVHELRTTMGKVDTEIKRLEQRAEKLKADALSAYRKGDKKSAISVVKRKKRVDKEIQDKDIQYQRLLSMLEQLVMSKQTKEIIDVYKEGSNAFKATLARQGLTLDNVDNTLESVSDAMQDYQDIDNALREGISNISAHGDSVDEDELETELREILAEDKYKGEKEGEGGTVGPSQVRLGKRILEISDLPDVPTRSLASTTPKGKGVDLEERWKRLRTGVAE